MGRIRPNTFIALQVGTLNWVDAIWGAGCLGTIDDPVKLSTEDETSGLLTLELLRLTT